MTTSHAADVHPQRFDEDDVQGAISRAVPRRTRARRETLPAPLRACMSTTRRIPRTSAPAPPPVSTRAFSTRTGGAGIELAAYPASSGHAAVWVRLYEAKVPPFLHRTGPRPLDPGAGAPLQYRDDRRRRRALLLPRRIDRIGDPGMPRDGPARSPCRRLRKPRRDQRPAPRRQGAGRPDPGRRRAEGCRAGAPRESPVALAGHPSAFRAPPRSSAISIRCTSASGAGRAWRRRSARSPPWLGRSDSRWAYSGSPSRR